MGNRLGKTNFGGEEKFEDGVGEYLGKTNFGGEEKFEDALEEDIYGPEHDLHTSLLARGCEKNPKHKGFIPVKKFSKKHLPEWCPKKDEFVDFVKSTADLVVKISASTVSTDRPVGTSHYENRGKKALRNCSGYVRWTDVCGPRGEGVKVAADWIEDYLEECELSKPEKWRGGNLIYKQGLARNFALECLQSWKRANLGIDKWGDKIDIDTFSRDAFTRVLMCEIQSCREKHESEKKENVTERERQSMITLNDFRKSRGLSVSDFCMALSRGLGDSDDGKSVKNFWSEFGPLLEKPCSCSECLQSENPQNIWCAVNVVTATHAIFDSQEAKSATVSLFYDDKDSQPVTMTGLCDDGGHLRYWGYQDKVDTDKYSFICSLHDVDRGQWLQSHIKHTENKWRKLHGSNHCPTIVISHPHGSYKYITVGKEGKSDKVETRVYTAPTCPGSSGGLVMAGNRWWWYRKVSSHSRAINKQYGRSARWDDFLFL